jgi:hypothetical protein
MKIMANTKKDRCEVIEENVTKKKVMKTRMRSRRGK